MQFYLTPSHVGQPRAAACVEALAELNGYVHTAVLPEPALTEAAVARFHVVVFTNTPRAEQLRWNAFCRAHKPHPIVFLSGACGGCTQPGGRLGGRAVAAARVRARHGRQRRAAMPAALPLVAPPPALVCA